MQRRMVERVLTHCATDRKAAEALLILLRRFATESAREEARMFCDELMAEEATAPHDLIAALSPHARRRSRGCFEAPVWKLESRRSAIAPLTQ